jgi:hypothetical protein
MTQYIDKSDVVAEIENYISNYKEIVAKTDRKDSTWVDSVSMIEAKIDVLKHLLSFLVTLEVKEVDVWKTVDNINPPQADKNKIYCVFTKDRYILATVINHPKDEELLQWKCTEFPHHRYDMCEGDKYMQIV